MATSKKACCKCKLDLPLAAFNKKAAARDGLASSCRDCTNKAHRSKKSYWKMWKHYGIDEAEYNRMLTSQSGKCAICQEKPSGKQQRLHIDHDHATNKVRALLCNNCNAGLGQFKDNIHLLRAAVRYLDAWEASRVLLREESNAF